MQKRFQHYLAKHNCVEKCDCCGEHYILWEKSLSVDNEVVLDLCCKLCAGVYLAIFRNDSVSWLEKIIRDSRVSRRAVKRHFSGRRNEYG